MPNRPTGIRPMVALLIVISVGASLVAAYRRFHVEAANRRVEIAVEWQEVFALAQAAGRPPEELAAQFKARGVTTLVIAEDTVTSLEQAGAAHPMRTVSVGGTPVTSVDLDSAATLARVDSALRQRGLDANTNRADQARTVFRCSSEKDTSGSVAARLEYATLRTMGLGLPVDAVAAARSAGMQIAARIGNFAGVNETSARSALDALTAAGARTIIFSGDEVLGYRGLEKPVAAMLTPLPGANPAGLIYGAVEFGKQKGDEKLTAALKGEYVRVHSIQVAEMAQMEEDEAVDRFVRAAKERNIRFCYVRLAALAGPDPVELNLQFLSKIARGIAHGSLATGGGLGLGPARVFQQTGVSTALFALISLGAGAGVVWLLKSLAPFPNRLLTGILVAVGAVSLAAAALPGDSGRKLIAFLVGVVYPAAACLVTFPGSRLRVNQKEDAPTPLTSLIRALRSLGVASAITAVGIIQVVGLLASRTFMMRADQFLGIKAQHAVPLLIVALVAIAGGVANGESFAAFRERAARSLREAMSEPARFGTLLLGLIALAGLALVVARTGNDAGVGVSGTELKFRALLDRILPVRPRTKEFLVGHPAFVLALAWWHRGRRRLAIPTFVVGSLGQVSLLNTFCHIHTPLIVSIWRDGLGLLFGALLGAALFLAFEVVMRSTESGAKAAR